MLPKNIEELLVQVATRKRELGIIIPSDADEKLRQKRQEINNLFDAVAHERDVQIVTVFRQVYGNDNEALPAMWQFLRDVGECPPEIIAHCQNLLAPKE